MASVREMGQALREIARLTREVPAWPADSGLPGVMLTRGDVPPHQLAAVYEPILGFTVFGRKTISIGGHTVDAKGPSYYVIPSDVPATGSVRSGKEGDGYLSLGLRLNHSVLRELLRVLPAEPRGAVAERLVAVTPSNEFVDAWCRMLRLVRTPEAIPALGPVYEREILYRVLSGPDGARLRLCGFEGGSSVRVHESIQTIRERYSETIDVRLLAADSGMSWTTFHRQFKRVTGLSPIQYQKELRLLEARKILVYEGLSVREAAFQVGYESASQFNREYSRLFGAPPAADAARIREAELESPASSHEAETAPPA